MSEDIKYSKDLETATTGEYVILRECLGFSMQSQHSLVMITHATKMKIVVDKREFNRRGSLKGRGPYSHHAPDIIIVTEVLLMKVKDDASRRKSKQIIESVKILNLPTDVLESIAVTILEYKNKK